MKENILFTVVSIGFNCKDLIEPTFNSVIYQTFKNFEYIIVDNNSTDGSSEILKNLVSKYTDIGIKYIRENDRGISDAMNKGALKSSGKLIIYLHFGDIFASNNILETVSNNFLINNWKWAAGNLLVANSSIKFSPKTSANLIKQNCVPHQACFIDKKLLLESGGFDINLKQAMDYDLWLRLFLNKSETLYILNFDIAFFDSNGVSNQIIELISANWNIRSKYRASYPDKFTLLGDIFFIVRIYIYWIFYNFSKLVF
jgi:glycosyltransferase involved in cell wall biosynthesis